MVEALLINIGILAVFIFFSGFFSSIETAFYSVDRFKMRRLFKKERKGAKQLYALKQQPTRFLVTILLLNNIVNIGAASFATAVTLQVFPGNTGIAVATFGITFLVLVFGEITPKALATKHAVKFSLAVSRPLYYITIILSPITFLLDKFADFVSGTGKKESLTEEELRMIVSLGVEEGAINEKERRLIHRVFMLDETTAGEIMTPRVEVVDVEADKTLKQLRTQLKKIPHSKLPVYDDEVDNIVGIFSVRKALEFLGRKLDVKVRSLMDEPLFVPVSKKIDALLREFQQKKVYIAVVVDDHGGFQGIVTIEDIIEELVGEIVEEKDVEPGVELVNEKTVVVDGSTELGQVNEELGTTLASKEYNTVAGLILEQIARFPRKGEKIKLGNISFEILKAKKNKIEEVKISTK